MATIQISLTTAEKSEAEKLFRDLGLTTTSAIKMFLQQSIREQGIPFQPTKIKRVNLSSKKEPIVLRKNEQGAFVLPGHVSERLKEWVEHG